MLPVSDAKTDFSGHRHMMLSAFDPSSSEEQCAATVQHPGTRSRSLSAHLVENTVLDIDLIRVFDYYVMQRRAVPRSVTVDVLHLGRFISIAVTALAVVELSAVLQRFLFSH